MLAVETLKQGDWDSLRLLALIIGLHILFNLSNQIPKGVTSEKWYMSVHSS